MVKKQIQIKDLIFFRQEIISYPNDGEVREYELLLRAKNDGCYIFPEELFYEIIENRKYHEIYISHICKILNNIFKRKSCIYSLNIDYQELYYPETIEFLREFKYKNNLKLELTERIPLYRDNPYEEFVPVEIIKEIFNLGYTIVFDDFLSGVNTFETLFMIEQFISRVKISALPFKKVLAQKELEKFLFSVVNTIAFLGKEIVIEGVEEEEIIQIFPTEWKQQTYLYDCPHFFDYFGDDY